MRFVKKVNERGVLTLPVEVREALDVQDGDIVEFEVLNVIKRRIGVAPTEPVTGFSMGGTA